MSDTFTWLTTVADDSVALLLLDTVVKATALLIVACFTAAVLRRASAAVRHRTWCLAFSGLLLLPVLSSLLPGWRVPILPELPQPAATSAADEASMRMSDPAMASPPIPLEYEGTVGTTMPPEQLPWYEPAGDFAAVPSPDESLVAQPADSELEAECLLPGAPTPSTVASGSTTSPISWQAPMGILWLVGLSVTVLSIIVSFVYIRILVIGARPVDAERTRLLWEVCRGLGVRRTVRLLETDKPLVPMTWGVLRPTVLLPLAWRGWSEQRRRFVLLHELAHVKRCDVAFQLLARLACALYWFHPLAWYALRRLRVERELACDDCVLTAGGAPSDYAQQLVEIARNYRLLAMPGTVAMARSTGLERRVRALLDRARSHLPLSRGAGRLVLVCAALVVTCVAAIHPVARSEPQQERAAEVAEARASEEDGEEPTPPNVADDEKTTISGRVLGPEGQPKRQTSTGSTTRQKITVGGVVLSPDGKPMAGITVRATTPVWAMLEPIVGEDAKGPVSEVKTQKDGRFTVSFTTQPFGDLSRLDRRWREIWKKTKIAAFAPGYGPAWIVYEDIRPNEPVTLRLVPDLPIKGRVIDLAGKPVARLAVRVGGPSAAENEDLTPWLRAIQAGEVPWTVWKFTPKSIAPGLVGIPEEVTTDEQGQFEIRGVGRERHLALVFESETVAHRSVRVVTRPMEPINRVISTPPFQATEPVYGAEFTLTAAPSRPVAGTVRDAETGRPLAGVSVDSYKLKDYVFSNHRVLKTTTDEQGRFRLIGMPKGKGNRLLVVPNDDQPYFMREVEVPDPSGAGPATVDIELRRGVWITGRVTDKATGRPVQARLHYLPFRSNKFAKAAVEFDDDGNVDGDQLRYQTRGDGTFRLVGLPGRAVVGAQSVLRQYRRGVGYRPGPGPNGRKDFNTYRNPLTPGPKWPDVMQEIDPPANAESVTVNFEMDPGQSIRIMMVDPGGQPITGVKVDGRTSGGYRDTVHKSTFEAINFAPGEQRTIVFHHEGRNLGWVVRIGADQADSEPITLQLQPNGTLKGRLLHPDGAPVTGAEVNVRVLPGEDFSKRLPSVTTNAQGRFQCTLPPGGKYHLMVEGAGIDLGTSIAEEVSVEPGRTKDLGEVTIAPRRREKKTSTQTGSSDILEAS